MTAKHRKGKSNHKHEDNFFKNEVLEAEARSGGNSYTLFLILTVLLLIGGFTGAWFCFQQHQTLTYLTDNLMGIQMKIVKLQSSHEDLRLANKKQIPESVETRLTALEESYVVAQKKVGMALATAEQLKMSDLPSQVLSLQTEMNARLAEMQQATVSLEQLGQLQGLLTGKNEELEEVRMQVEGLEEVRMQVEGLAVTTGELSQTVEVLAKSRGEAHTKLEEKYGQLATLSAALDGQATEMSRLEELLGTYRAQVETTVSEMAAIRELLETERSPQPQEAGQEEQLNKQVHETQPATEPLEHTEEEEPEAAGEEEAADAGTAEEEEEEEAADEGTAEEAAAAEEEAEAAAAATGEEDQTPPAAQAQEAFFFQEESAKVDDEEVDSQGATPVEHEETLPEEEEEAAGEGEEEQEESVAVSGKEEVDTTHAEEEPQRVEEQNQEADKEKIRVELVVEEEIQEEAAAEEEEEEEAEEEEEEGEGDEDAPLGHENDYADDVIEYDGEEEQGGAGEEEEEEALPENK
ncbi:uncharacterized protein zgc:66479 isoform X1 [Cololabis saira]|uniref:uncharacterized protein zgc:66479 isoform X1 n=1 Tax=Cololabis saira TaxID=129043 RepID=UPI002AD50DE6|nr:uncharacterized protein zgc:66479 isoform X1 [Cololabis saira]